VNVISYKFVYNFGYIDPISSRKIFVYFLVECQKKKIHILSSESISLWFYWKKEMAFPEEENQLLQTTTHKFEPCLQEMYIIRQSISCVFKNKVFNSLELRKEI
jgi:hypothetical protein